MPEKLKIFVMALMAFSAVANAVMVLWLAGNCELELALWKYESVGNTAPVIGHNC